MMGVECWEILHAPLLSMVVVATKVHEKAGFHCVALKDEVVGFENSAGVCLD
jgi:hypothetical protein